MENHEIAPAPVSNVEELLSKMDMILGATKQWINEDDDMLAALIYRRVQEIPSDIATIQGHQEHWEAFNAKAVAITHAFRKKAAVEFRTLNSLN